jgi:hypothetical protein
MTDNVRLALGVLVIVIGFSASWVIAHWLVRPSALKRASETDAAQGEVFRGYGDIQDSDRDGN